MSAIELSLHDDCLRGWRMGPDLTQGGAAQKIKKLMLCVNDDGCKTEGFVLCSQ